MPERIERDENNLTLVVDTIKKVIDRSDQRLEPGESIKPLPLKVLQEAFNEITTEELVPNSLLNYWIQLVDKSSPKDLAAIFGSCEKYCFMVIPVSGETGEPLTENDIKRKKHFYRLKIITADGLTRGFSGRDCYLFPVIPAETQASCVFEAPYYQNFVWPSPQEKEELKKRIINAFKNLQNNFPAGRKAE